MNTSHTPGPWAFEQLCNDDCDFVVLGGRGMQTRVAVECSERDAALIAAAPDMLAALYRSAAALESVSYCDPSIASALDVIRAAVVRATGGAA